jgi:uncharacterized protein (DUF1501 family)
LQFVRTTAASAFATSERLVAMADEDRASPTGYPDSELAAQLRLVARMIRSGMRTPIYYTAHDGFDTHAGQLARHSLLLSRLGGAVSAFFDDLAKSGEADRVVMLVFSEFGRRLVENASGGTDHGTAAPVFLVGPAVAVGVHGPNPNLVDLEDGDPRHAIDFRQVYATILEKWLACPADKVLGGRFALPLLGG